MPFPAASAARMALILSSGRPMAFPLFGALRARLGDASVDNICAITWRPLLRGRNDQSGIAAAPLDLSRVGLVQVTRLPRPAWLRSIEE
jgi:hypothetical protein